MIVYTGHPIFKWVYVCNERGANLGRLIGFSPGCGPWRLMDHEQPLGVDAEVQLERLGLVRGEIDGNGIDGSGVFHGTPPRKLSEIDMSDVFGPVPAGLHRREPALKLKRCNELRTRTKYKFTADLTRIIQGMASDRSRKHDVEALVRELGAIIDFYFTEE